MGWTRHESTDRSSTIGVVHRRAARATDGLDGTSRAGGAALARTASAKSLISCASGGTLAYRVSRPGQGYSLVPQPTSPFPYGDA